MPTAAVSPKQSDILTHAARRMMDHGIQKTTMQDIARDCSMAVGTLYLSFKNKDEIVLAIADQYRQEQITAAEEMLASTLSPTEKFTTFLMEKYRFLMAFRHDKPHGQEFSRILLDVNPSFPEECRTRMIDNLSQILAEGVEQGVFNLQEAEIQREAEGVYHALRGFLSMPHLMPVPEPKEEDLRFLIEWLLARWRPATS